MTMSLAQELIGIFLLALSLLLPVGVNWERPKRAILEALVFGAAWGCFCGFITRHYSLLFAEWLFDVTLPFFIYLGIRFAPWWLQGSRSAWTYFLGLFQFFCLLQILFGLLYYAIYVWDNSEFTFLSKEISEGRVEFIESALNKQLDLHKNLVICRAAGDLFRSRSAIRRTGAHLVTYTIKGTDKPFLQITFVFEAPPGAVVVVTGYQLVIELSVGTLINFADPDISPLSVRIYESTSDDEVAELLGKMAAVYEERIHRISEQVKRVDTSSLEPSLFDFLLFSLHMSNVLGHEVILANKFLTKFVSMLQAIGTLFLVLVIANLYRPTKAEPGAVHPNG